jgi:hypothetical protein
MKMNLLTTQQIFIESARKCCANAERLLSDAQMVEFEKPKPVGVVTYASSDKIWRLCLIVVTVYPACI